MKAKHYQFFETYFNNLRTDLNPENAAINLVKAFIFPLLGLFMATYVAITVSNKNYTWDTLIGMLIIVTFFGLIYFTLSNAGLMKKIMKGNLDHIDNTQLPESRFNMMVNMIISSSKVLERDRKKTEKLEAIDKVYLYETLHYLLEVGNDFNDSVQHQKNGDSTINNARYYALLDFYLNLVDDMKEFVDKFNLDDTIIKEIDIFITNINSIVKH
jgi:hypothetical protein